MFSSGTGKQPWIPNHPGFHVTHIQPAEIGGGVGHFGTTFALALRPHFNHEKFDKYRQTKRKIDVSK